jgi:hypothetical protein
MPENEPDILKEFAEFLEAKKASEQESADAEDFEVEIWDKDGRGVRTRRSHAKPFLNSLGIDVDAPASTEGDGKSGTGDGKGGKANGPTGRKPASSAASGAPSGSIARKYFAPKPAAGK